MTQDMFISWVLGFLMKKIVIPVDFHSQAEAIGTMLTDDVSGLVDSLTDFAVESATVEYGIETSNTNLDSILDKWLSTINISYGGQIIPGIRTIAKEYFKERWKGASFPVLKIAKWDLVDGMLLPTKAFVVDGKSIHVKDSTPENKDVNLLNYNYVLGKNSEEPLDKNCIFIRGHERLFDKYPVPFLIKRGVYHNWKLIYSIKNMESQILDQVIPYLLLIKRGSDALATTGTKTYDTNELKTILEDFQNLYNQLKDVNLADNKATVQTPTRVTTHDEDIKHLIPDLSTIFDSKLFSQAERNILAGLGFIDVIQGISDSRRESVLNPKVFIEEVKSGVEDFRQALTTLVLLILEKNKTKIKYKNEDFYITASPVKGFMTDEFKNTLRQMYDRGRLSSQTYAELVGEVDFKTEVNRREKEAKKGIESIMYPQIIQNTEEKGFDTPENKNNYDINDEEIPQDKIDEIEKKEYEFALEMAFAPVITENYIRFRQLDPNEFDKTTFRTIVIDKKRGIKGIVGKKKEESKTTLQSYIFLKEKWSKDEANKWVENHKSSELVTSPYVTVTDLPKQVKDNMTINLQRVFMNVFNKSFKKYGEIRAFRTAWAVIRKVGIKNSKGIWVKK